MDSNVSSNVGGRYYGNYADGASGGAPPPENGASIVFMFLAVIAACFILKMIVSSIKGRSEP